MDDNIRKIINNCPPGKKDQLIPLLQDIQSAEGHLSPESIAEVSKHMNIPLNKVYGVATFYDQFRFRDRGKYHFRICSGTACHIYRSAGFLSELEKLLKVKSGQTSKDGRFSLEVVSCLGACNNAPVMAVNEKYYSAMPLSDLPVIISSLK